MDNGILWLTDFYEHLICFLGFKGILTVFIIAFLEFWVVLLISFLILFVEDLAIELLHLLVFLLSYSLGRGRHPSLNRIDMPLFETIGFIVLFFLLIALLNKLFSIDILKLYFTCFLFIKYPIYFNLSPYKVTLF